MADQSKAPGTEPADRPAEPLVELPPACAALRVTLYARADGEKLGAVDEKAVREHLKVCGDCAAEFRRAGEFTTKIGNLLGSLKPPSDLKRRVLDRIGAASPRRKLILGIAGLAAVAILGVIVLSRGGVEPVMRISHVRGRVRVLRSTGAGWRPRRGAADVRAGERLDLADGATAKLSFTEGVVELEGPARVQVEVDGDGFVRIHLLRETRMKSEIFGGGFVLLRIWHCELRTAGAEFSLDVDATGEGELAVAKGGVSVRDAKGVRAVKAGEKTRLVQFAGPDG